MNRKLRLVLRFALREKMFYGVFRRIYWKRYSRYWMFVDGVKKEIGRRN